MPKKRCWCRKTCGKPLSDAGRLLHYRRVAEAGEEDDIQPSDSLDESISDVESNNAIVSAQGSWVNMDEQHHGMSLLHIRLFLTYSNADSDIAMRNAEDSDSNSEAEDCNSTSDGSVASGSDSSGSNSESVMTSEPSLEDSNWAWSEVDREDESEDELWGDEELFEELEDKAMGYREELHTIRMYSCCLFYARQQPVL